MAIKKKPVKSVKKVQPKKAAKPAPKKAVAKKPAPAKPAKKDSSKKITPVVKKHVASASKSANSQNLQFRPKKQAVPARQLKKQPR